MCRTMMGTREARDIIKMNDSVRIGGLVCRAYRGGYRIMDRGIEIIRTSNIDIALDWLVEMGYLCETRFRLTAEQKDILKQRIYEYIGYALCSGLIMTMSLVFTMAWLFVG